MTTTPTTRLTYSAACQVLRAAGVADREDMRYFLTMADNFDGTYNGAELEADLARDAVR